MNNPINEVVNNIAERFSPAVESLSAISQTIVQETSNAGFAYTMLGVGLFSLSLLCLAIMVWALKYLDTQKDECAKELTITFTILAAMIFFVSGWCLVENNLSNWIAPTRGVVMEIVKITGG